MCKEQLGLRLTVTILLTGLNPTDQVPIPLTGPKMADRFLHLCDVSTPIHHAITRFGSLLKNILQHCK